VGFQWGLLEEVSLSPELLFLSAADKHLAQQLRGISCTLDI